MLFSWPPDDWWSFCEVTKRLSPSLNLLLRIFQIFSFFQCGCPYTNQNWDVLGISKCIGYQFSKILLQNPIQKDFLLQYSDQIGQSVADQKTKEIPPWKFQGAPRGAPLEFSRTWIFPGASSSAVPVFSRTWIISRPGFFQERPAVHSLVLCRALIFLGARYIHG